MKEIIEGYLDKIRKVQEKYLFRYFITYANSFTGNTAQEFLKENKSDIEKELTAISLNTILQNQLSDSDKAKIMEINGVGIISLQDKIIEVSK